MLFGILYDTIHWKRILFGKICLIKKTSTPTDFPDKTLILLQKPKHFHSGKLQTTLVGFHLSEKWVKNQTMAWAFIPQCSFFHKNHIMKTSEWDSHLLLLLPRSCTAQSPPPSYTQSDFSTLAIKNKKAKPDDLYN